MKTVTSRVGTIIAFDKVVKGPAVILVGGASPAWVHNGAQGLARGLKDAQRRTLEGQDHAVAPEVLAPVLVQFFDGGSGTA